VRVNRIPVRYGGKTYRMGETIQIEEKYYEQISKYVTVVIIKDFEEDGEMEEKITEEFLENLGYHDLKSFIKNQGLNAGSRRKHVELLEFAKENLL
jgi:hypothetical protein